MEDEADLFSVAQELDPRQWIQIIIKEMQLNIRKNVLIVRAV